MNKKMAREIGAALGLVKSGAVEAMEAKNVGMVKIANAIHRLYKKGKLKKGSRMEKVAVDWGRLAAGAGSGAALGAGLGTAIPIPGVGTGIGALIGGGLGGAASLFGGDKKPAAGPAKKDFAGEEARKRAARKARKARSGVELSDEAGDEAHA